MANYKQIINHIIKFKAGKKSDLDFDSLTTKGKIQGLMYCIDTTSDNDLKQSHLKKFLKNNKILQHAIMDASETNYLELTIQTAYDIIKKGHPVMIQD